MKKPHWLEKENLYKIMFESEHPVGRVFDLTLITAISLSIIISFVETIPSLAHTFKFVLEILEYLLTFFFTVEYIARVYCSPRPRDYVLSFFGIIDLLSTLPPYLSYFLPNARYMILLRSIRFIRIFRIFKLFSFINEGYILMHSLQKSLTKISVYFLFVLILDICLGTLMFMVLHADALAAEESHQDFRLLLVCADTRYLLGYADVYGRKRRAQYPVH